MADKNNGIGCNNSQSANFTSTTTTTTYGAYSGHIVNPQGWYLITVGGVTFKAPYYPNT